MSKPLPKKRKAKRDVGGGRLHRSPEDLTLGERHQATRKSRGEDNSAQQSQP